ncbi:MAG: HAD hydrolase-like protein [Pseudomonadota bacterium]|nr:HAD hydrolase-like protein [Pseudomonadota bacterium]
MKKQLAIFDFDGTLANSMEWFSGVMNDVARQHGFRQISDEEREMLRGRSSREIVKYMGIPAWKLPLIARHMRKIARRDTGKIPAFPWLSHGDMPQHQPLKPPDRHSFSIIRMN